MMVVYQKYLNRFIVGQQNGYKNKL